MGGGRVVGEGGRGGRGRVLEVNPQNPEASADFLFWGFLLIEIGVSGYVLFRLV